MTKCPGDWLLHGLVHPESSVVGEQAATVAVWKATATGKWIKNVTAAIAQSYQFIK